MLRPVLLLLSVTILLLHADPRLRVLSLPSVLEHIGLTALADRTAVEAIVCNPHCVGAILVLTNVWQLANKVIAPLSASGLPFVSTIVALAEALVALPFLVWGVLEGIIVQYCPTVALPWLWLLPAFLLFRRVWNGGLDTAALGRAQAVLQWHEGLGVAGNMVDAVATPRASRKGSARASGFPAHNPGTGEPLGTLRIQSAAEVNEAVNRARAAQVDSLDDAVLSLRDAFHLRAWRETDFNERRRVLRVLLQLILDNQDDIARVAAADSGKTATDAYIGELLTVCEKLRWTLSCGEGALTPETVWAGPLLGFTKKATVEYLPLGVIGVIIPWNYPFQNIFGSIIAPLFAGNAVVVKPSEWTSWSTPYFAQFIDAALVATGHSPDLCQFVCGDGSTGAALVASGVDKVILIGAPGTGKRVMESAAGSLTPVTLELGGKDPMILCDDISLGAVLPYAMRGVFQNCGQNCIGVERLMIHDAIYERAVEDLAGRVRALRQGCSVPGSAVTEDCGAMSMPAQLDIVDALVQDAVRKGARLLAGGHRNRSLKGDYYVPTLLADVDESMLIAKEEVFGPVMTIMRWSTDAEVVRIANDCSGYGLAASVFSRSKSRADKIARQLRCGTVCVNDFGVAYLAQALPFGGVGISGFGKFNGREGLRDCCFSRGLLTDRFPLLHGWISAIFPPFLSYPVSPKAPQLIKHFLSTFFGVGVRAQVTGLARLFGAILRPVRK